MKIATSAFGGLAMALLFPLTPAFAEEPASNAPLQMARADHWVRQRQFTQALEELGRLPKSAQEDPQFRQRLTQSLQALYRQGHDSEITSGAASASRSQKPVSRVRTAPPPRLTQSVRVTRRRRDSDRNSDQNGDPEGWQMNEHLQAELPIGQRLRARFVADLDGFKNGHNDLRYRTLLADFSKGSSHLALGDSSSYPSPYFLRGSRLRGMNFFLSGETHELQAVLGGYPVWLESRDEYIYPRTVWGIRDRLRLGGGRFQLGGGLIQTRDSEKVRTEDGANPQARVDPINQPRDNVAFSLDQQWEPIPGVFWLKAAESYSVTDDNLLEDRFGDTRKLKDTAFQAESRLNQPWFRWRGWWERVGPDYRLLTDFPQGAVSSPKDVRVDIQRIEQLLDFSPLGPVDLDLEGSWVRNNLDNDDTVGHVRQSWTTAHLGLLTPPSWPQPRFRGTWYDTVSSPGSTTRPSQTRSLDLNGELTKKIWGSDLGAFANYEVEHPLKEKALFDEEESWSLGTRFGRPLGDRWWLSGRYKYQVFDELFDEVRERGIRHQIDLGPSVRLWSTARLSLGYSFLHGEFVDQGGTRLTSTDGHLGTAHFSWPYVWNRRDRRRKLTFHPALMFHLSDFDRGVEERPLFAGRLGLGYESPEEWRIQLLGEFRTDDDDETDLVRTEESRIWLLWTSQWR